MPHSNLTVRLSKPEDFEAIQKLNAALFKYEDDLNRHTRNLDWPYTEYAVTYFHNATTGQAGCQAFIAEINGQTVGYLIAVFQVKLYMRASPVAEIENMFVEEAFRGQGIGSKLVDRFKQWASEHDVKFLRVGAWAANHSAINFYRRHGFEVMETMLEQPLGGWGARD